MGEHLCPYEARWKETRGVPKLLKIERLDPIYKIWILLLFSKILPTSSNNWINKERNQLLYGFREGWVMNLGRVIYTSLLDCTMEMPKGKLPFPQLITALCVAAEVDFNPLEEEMIDPPAPIDCRTVRGIWDEFEMMEEKRRTKKEPQLPDVRCKLATLEESMNKKFEDLKYQRNMWKFWARYHNINPAHLPKFGEGPMEDSEWPDSESILLKHPFT